MATLIFSWLYMGWLFLAVGFAGFKLTSAFLKPGSFILQKISLDYYLVLGFSIISVLCGYLSIFIPLNTGANVLFLILGLGLTARFFSDLVVLKNETLAQWKFFSRPLRVTVIILFFVVLVFGVGEAITQVDTKLYHAQTIRWIKEFSVVPGLGNIHGRFAFNSHYFLPSALFSTIFSETRVLYPGFSFFFLILCCRLLINLERSAKDKDWFYASVVGVLLFWFVYLVTPRLRVISTDDITCVLVFYVFFLFWETAFQPNEELKVFLLWIIVISAITFKLSSLFLALIIPFTFYRFKKKQVFLLVASGLIILTPFIIRNIYLSGYLIYPFPSLDVINVDWKIPLEAVVYEKEYIEAWARLPRPPVPEEEAFKMLDLSFTTWFETWWPQQHIRWRLIFPVNLLLLLVFLKSLLRRRYKVAVLALVVLINLAFWFYSAPDARFAYGFLFLGFGLVVAFVLQFVLKWLDRLQPKLMLLLPLLLFLPLSLFLSRNSNLLQFQNPDFWLYPGRHDVIETEDFEAINFTLRVPLNKNLRCFNTPLPCTPYPKKKLMMRGKSYQSGFRIMK